MQDVTFTINLHDRDGDVFEKCILIHHKDIILKFKDFDEYNDFINQLEVIKREIERDHLGGK